MEDSGNKQAPVIVYMSSVAGNLKAKKNITETMFLLKSAGVEFTEIDVSVDEAAKAAMLEGSGKRTLPQVFVAGKFIGGFEEISEANEYGEVKLLLGLE